TVAVIAWCLWYNRNNWMWNGLKDTPTSSATRAAQLTDRGLACCQHVTAAVPTAPCCHRTATVMQGGVCGILDKYLVGVDGGQ
ncbi:hypothetical protein A2U01_0048007, partial [Trifolium medium]|nr:hypothetical protein [Trifolium medium]